MRGRAVEHLVGPDGVSDGAEDVDLAQLEGHHRLELREGRDAGLDLLERLLVALQRGQQIDQVEPEDDGLAAVQVHRAAQRLLRLVALLQPVVRDAAEEEVLRLVRGELAERAPLRERQVELAGAHQGVAEPLAGDDQIGLGGDQALVGVEQRLVVALLAEPLDVAQLGGDLRAVLEVVLVGGVVAGARGGVGEDLVRLADLLEVLGVRVRRELAHQAEVGLLDGALVGGALDAQDGVVVLGLVFPHWRAARLQGGRAELIHSEAASRQSPHPCPLPDGEG